MRNTAVRIRIWVKYLTITANWHWRYILSNLLH